jgi:competence protein ComEC
MVTLFKLNTQNMFLVAMIFLSANLIGLSFSNYLTLWFVSWFFCLFTGGAIYFLPTHRYAICKKWLCIITVAFCHLTYLTYFNLRQAWPEALSGKTVILSGYVSSLVSYSDFTTSFTFQPYAIKNGDTWQDISIGNLAIYAYRKKITMKAGAPISIEVKLKHIHNVLNAFAMDSEKFQFINHIAGNANLKRLLPISNGFSMHPPIQDKLSFALLHFRENLQNRFFKSYEKHFSPEKREKEGGFVFGLFVAIILGIRVLSRETWQLFQNTGTSHLMAISGLHVGMLVGVVLLILKKIGRYFFISKQGVFLILAVVVIFYGALSGFGFPVERASLMLILFLLFKRLYRHFGLWDFFSLSLTIALWLDPYCILNNGFILSYAAVACLIYIAQKQEEKKSFLKELIFIQCQLSLLLIPMTLGLFQKTPLLSPIVNLILIPFFSFLLLPAGFLVFVSEFISSPINALSWQLFWWLSLFLEKTLVWFSQFEQLIFYRVLSYQEVLSLTIGLLFLLAPKGFPGRLLGFIFCLPILINPTEKLPFQSAFLTVFDVGEGLCVLIRTEKHQLLYDTGPAWPGGDRSLQFLPYLRRQNRLDLDRIVISHRDRDHVGGLQSVLSVAGATPVWNNEKIPLLSITPTPCRLGEKWNWDGVLFEFLYPSEDLWQNNQFLGGKHNNASCVLKVTAKNMTVLLPGDIESFAERYLVTHESAEIKSDVLLAPHHGSRTSSSQKFLEAVHPKLVIISAGYLNAYHFPAKTVLSRYNTIGASVLNTTDCGMIEIKNMKPTPKIACFRQNYPRLWRN